MSKFVTSVEGRLTRILIESTVQGGRNAQDHLDLWEETQTALGSDLSSITLQQTTLDAHTAAIADLQTSAAQVAAQAKMIAQLQAQIGTLQTQVKALE
jgi:pyrroloquinoline quinone (PQQ) biosynthesis protein C